MSRRRAIGPAAVGLLLALIALALPPRLRRNQTTTGDEPHYLVLAHSIAHDGDLLPADNYTSEITREFFWGTLSPEGHISHARTDRSIHYPLFSVLIAPAYALDGRDGVMALMVLLHLSAFIAIATTLRRLGLGPWSAWTLPVAFVFAVPWTMMVGQIYPDSLALVIVAWIVRAASADRRSAPRGIVAGLLVGLLAALHIKFALLAATLAIGMILLARSAHFAAAILLAVASMTALNLLWLGALYGIALPWAPYGTLASHGGGGSLLLGLAANLCDPQYGLLPAAPAYLAFTAAVVLGRRMSPGFNRRFLVFCLASALVHLLLIASTRIQLFGWSTAARNLTAAVPLAVIPVTMTIAATADSMRRRALWAILIAMQTSWTIVLLAVGRNVQYNARRWWSEALHLPPESIPFFHDFFTPDDSPNLQAWCLAFAFLTLAAIIAFATTRSRSKN